MLYTLGGPYFSGGPPYQEGIQFNYIGGNWTLTISYSDLWQREIKDISEGTFYFGAFVEENILFLLFKAGSSWEWSDAPYSWWLVPDENRTVPSPYKARERCLLNIFLVDASVNRILHMRSITIPPKVSKVIVNAIINQTESFMSTKEGYTEAIQKIRDKYTPAEMSRLGVIGRGGE